MSVTVALALGVLGSVPAPEPSQPASLEALAGQVAHAFASHDFRSILGGPSTVWIHLPGQPIGPRTRSVAAVAALDGFVRGARELEVKVHGARVVEEEYGYIELGRRFRVALVGEEQAHRVLLALRRTEGRWLVTEILIL